MAPSRDIISVVPVSTRMPLPGLPGSTEFMQAYEAALAGQALPRPMIGASRTKPGSIAALIVSYFCAPQFLALARQRNRHTD